MLPSHHLKIVLVEPEIPQNTGNIARLCAASGAELHLVRPLGFFLTDKHFRRAGMDYLKDVSWTVHDSLTELLAQIGDAPLFLTSGAGGADHWTAPYRADSWLFFGKESAGLPTEFLTSHQDLIYRIPMRPGARGLNLATAAGIILYDALAHLAKVPRAT